MNSRANVRQFDPVESSRMASELVAAFDQLCISSHEYVPVQGESFRGLDLGWYRRITTTLAGFSYQFIGDVQQQVAVPAGWVPGFLRLVLSADRGTVLLLCHKVQRHPLRLRNFFKTWQWDKGGYSLLLNTEFSDGSFCITSNELQLYDVEAGFTEQYLPPTLSLQTIMLRHKQLLSRYLRDQPELGPVRLESPDDIIARLNRVQSRRALARRARGVFTEAELWRLGYAPALARQLIAEMSRQRNDQ